MRSVGDWQVCGLLRFKGRCLPFFLVSLRSDNAFQVSRCDRFHSSCMLAFIRSRLSQRLNLLPDTALGSGDAVAQRTDRGE